MRNALLLKEELTEAEIETILGAPAYKKADSDSDEPESSDSQDENQSPDESASDESQDKD